MAKGNFIEYITDNNPNKYPIDGEQDGYYYERVEVGFLETIKSLKENIPALSFIGNEDFILKVYDTTKHWDGTLYYSTDYVTWNIWDGTEISSENKLLALRGTGNTAIMGNSSNYRFVFTGSDNLNIKCYGNIETLLDYQTVMNGNHPTMSNHCYAFMFYNCTSLTQAPELPATTLADYCYCYMFNRCTSLTIPPKVLPATTLADYCYYYMFEFTSIECIPKIMATTYAINSLAGMFDDIKTLNVYSSSGTGHTYGWTAPSANYTQGMFGSNDGEPEWAKLDGVNFPNSGTPTEGTTYYFKTLD